VRVPPGRFTVRQDGVGRNAAREDRALVVRLWRVVVRHRDFLMYQTLNRQTRATMACPHNASFKRDVIHCIVIVLVLFMVREFLCWFLKTNSSFSSADVYELLLRNGME
jgi:hypothetical protein